MCDGGEVERAKFPDLYDVVGTRYNGSDALNGFDTFRVPDLRGRFALGKQDMDNNIQVPGTEGQVFDNGGGDTAINNNGNTVEIEDYSSQVYSLGMGYTF